MPRYALAFDLGTTTLAASLIDTASGRRLAMTGSLNPQRRFGADVVSRLEAAVNSDETLREMAALVRAELRRLAGELCARTGIPWDEIGQAAIAGNPAMQHILLGLPVKSLAFPPFRPLFTGGKRLAAAELGWDGEAQIYLFPMPGGFVGGDTVAFLYGVEPGDAALCLDMGTNGEMALTEGETVWATSAAAGPAFEGGNLTCGMAALDGAISSVRIEGERLHLAVIGNGTPTGICGSGAIEAVSELLHNGILEPTGRLR
ncbi:MAG TPA: ASKHA domain-containing protein, partial [Desulfuromonadaceae bacterium]